MVHNLEFADWAVSPDADRGVVDGAVALALTAADFLTDPGLRDAVAKEFEAAGGRVDPATRWREEFGTRRVRKSSRPARRAHGNKLKERAAP
jgi:hypothetical protein